MILYPAIDLKDGNAVRLVHGDMDQTTVFNDDPAAQARIFVAAGCQWLHLVDLNGAFAGEPVNAAPVEAILKACPVPAQLGGIAAIIYTDILRDGAMKGPNIDATAALARAVDIPVIASGGVSSMADLEALKATDVIAGAISGRALYDGAIDLADALTLLA